MELTEFFTTNPRAAIAMSGGVDSTFLLAEAMRSGADVGAYFIKSVFQPEFERRDALEMSRKLGARLRVIELDVLDNPAVRANPADRCYHCKLAVFSAIKEAAARDGYSLILDGTNASDDEGDRPGMRALRELGVRSPLRECGLTKDEIRRRSRELGLDTAAKPAYACLATRIPTGTELTADALRRVEGAEGAMLALGYSDFRVRVYGGAARLQLPAEQLERAALRRGELIEAVEPYFSDIFLDLRGR